MILSTSELISGLESILLADAALNTWAVENFGKGITVCTGIDTKNPVQPEKYPAVVIFDIQRIRGNNTSKQAWEVSWGCALTNDGITTTANTVKIDGFSQVQDLREVVEDALLRSSDVGKIRITGDAESVDLYPHFFSMTSVSIEKNYIKKKDKIMSGNPNYQEETFLASGEVYIDLLNASGATTGEVDFGECSLFSIEAPSLEKKELTGHRRDTYSETVKSVITKKEQNIKLTSHDVNKFNMALQMLGSSTAYTQTAGDNVSGTAEDVVAIADKWTSLDHRMLDPDNAPVVKDDGDTTTYVEGTDYEIDYDSGRLLVLSSGSITDGDTLHVTSTWLAIASGWKVTGGTVNLFEAKVRLVGYDQANSRNFEIIVHKAQLEPSGEFNAMAEDFGQVDLTGKVLSTADGSIDTIFY